jgi:Zn-dependent protease with chaperone function
MTETPMTRALRRAILCGLVAIATWSPLRAAVTLEEFDRRILEELRSENPAAARLFEEADAARTAGRHGEAADLYRRVHVMVPRFSHALRRECNEEMALGNRPEALTLCRQALAIADSPENQAALAFLLTTGSAADTPTRAERSEAIGIARRAVRDRPDDVFAQLAFCQVALATEDLPALKAGALRLRSIAPDEMSTHYFLFVAAASEGRLEDAEDELLRARDRGLPEPEYRRLRDSLPAPRARTPALARIAEATGVAWVGGMALLFLVGLGLSRLALRAAARPPSAGHGRAEGLGAAARRAYAAVLWLCCAYYYLSIPLMVAAVLAGTAGIIYFFLFIGRIPIGFVLSLMGVSCVSLWAILRSLVSRSSRDEPGDRLALDQHPEFAALLRDVAERLSTPAIETVYLTPGTELAVMERGGVFRHLAGRSERCLILGVAALDGLRLGAFRALMAHEYGHLSNRDTAGGRLALAVRRSLTVMARHLARGRAAAWYNPAWLFIQAFHRVFLRISHGATRLQEVLADRWSAALYGAAAFEEGLRHVIGQAVRFSAHADATVKEVVESKRALDNIYAYHLAKPPDSAAIDAQIEAALTANPSPYQSHPAPAERFAYVREVPADHVLQQADGRREVWSLLRNRDRTEREMTDRLREIILARYKVSIPSSASTASPIFRRP